MQCLEAWLLQAYPVMLHQNLHAQQHVHRTAMHTTDTYH